MSYKPTNEDIIEYLYGELDESKKAQIEEYIAAHPDFRQEVEELDGMRMVMGQLEDEEVPSPMTFMTSRTNSEWLYWRKYVAIAASILLLFVIGKVSGFNISYDESGFQAGFGGMNQGLDAATVQEMLDADRSQIVNWVQENLESTQGEINGEINAIKASLDSHDNEVPEAILSDAAVDKLLQQQKDELLLQMAQLSDKLTDDYRDIFRDLYVNFADNIENKRLEDLRNIQNAFDHLESVTDEKQQEVEDAIFELSKEVNSLVESQNNENNN